MNPTHRTTIPFLTTMPLALLMLIVTPIPEAHADWMENVKGVWETTKEVGKKAIDTSKELGEKAVQAANEKGLSRTGNSSGGNDQERFQQVWNDTFPKLEEGVTYTERINDAPDFALFGDDKESLREDFNELLDEMITLLANDQAIDLRDAIRKHQQAIVKRRGEIQSYKEARISAPVEHVALTTRAGYDTKIRAAQADIVRHEGEIVAIQERFAARLRQIGVRIDRDQAAVLLTRVDSNDILQMAVVFEIIRKLTKQLMTLTEESGENLQHARKYYGMHVVLLESVAHMQETYIKHIDTTYLPRLENIIERTRSVQEESREMLKQDSDPTRRTIYQKNLQAQNLTLRTANIYQENLQNQRNKVQAARNRVEKDRVLAHNTFQTVQLSAQLLSLLKTSQEAFAAVMNLQVPEIVPFENLEMQKKYEELSKALQQQE
ncbi:MAG: hypothetical protein HQL50_04885 [Magnetococcales bacterium]|nr:hypothetical protein [Magnetococcales bacterium]